MPKMMTSVALKPNATAASTPPNAKTPARPSRYTALAMRNQKVGRWVAEERGDVAHEADVAREEADLLAVGARRRLGHVQHERDREHDGPHGAADGDQAVREPVRRVEPEPLERVEHDDEHERQDAADVAEPPARGR